MFFFLPFTPWMAAMSAPRTVRAQRLTDLDTRMQTFLAAKRFDASRPVLATIEAQQARIRRELRD